MRAKKFLHFIAIAGITTSVASSDLPYVVGTVLGLVDEKTSDAAADNFKENTGLDEMGAVIEVMKVKRDAARKNRSLLEDVVANQSTTSQSGTVHTNKKISLRRLEVPTEPVNRASLRTNLSAYSGVARSLKGLELAELREMFDGDSKIYCGEVDDNELVDALMQYKKVAVFSDDREAFFITEGYDGRSMEIFGEERVYANNGDYGPTGYDHQRNVYRGSDESGLLTKNRLTRVQTDTTGKKMNEERFDRVRIVLVEQEREIPDANDSMAGLKVN